MKIVLKPSAKNVLIPLKLTKAAASIDQLENFRSGMTTLTISN